MLERFFFSIHHFTFLAHNIVVIFMVCVLSILLENWMLHFERFLRSQGNGAVIFKSRWLKRKTLTHQSPSLRIVMDVGGEVLLLFLPYYCHDIFGVFKRGRFAHHFVQKI